MGVGAAAKAEPAVLEIGADGCSRGTLGYPLGLEGPRRAAMRPTWTPNGQRTANYRRMTALEGASGSALSFPSPPAGQPRARELEARVRTLLKRMNSPPRPLPL